MPGSLVWHGLTGWRKVGRRIFEPFFTTKPQGKGTGLGLAVVYGVVRQHDGVIRVYSEPRRGTVFRITLSIGLIEGGDASEVAPDVLPRGKGAVLLAENDMQVRRIAERILTANGFDVLLAGDG